jgi:spermidine synthase
MPLGLRSGERIIHYHDGESGTVAVTENAQGVRQLRINNRYGLATSSRRDVRRQRNEGRLGLLLADRPKSAAFIGIATGISLSSIEHFASLERIVAMELIPGVIDATSFFEEANLGVMHDPRLTIVVADARNHLYASGERFDVVVGDLFVPWHAGTGYLYTAEHFSLVADRLQPGGVFVQWLQGSIISIEEVKIIAATFADAFPEAQLWRVRNTAWLAFVGHATPDDVDPAIRIDDPRFGDFELICAGETLRHWTQGSLRNTDDYPIIEFWTAATHLADRPEAERRIHRTLRRLRAKWEREREGGLAPAQGSAQPVGSGSSAALPSRRNPSQTKS